MIVPCIAKEQTVDALILMGDTSRDYIHYLKKTWIFLIVFLDFYDNELAKDAVIADNFHGMYLMTEYLYEHGLTKLLAFCRFDSFFQQYHGSVLRFSKAVLEHRDVSTGGMDSGGPYRDERGQIEIHLPEQMPEAFVCNCDLTTAGLLMLELENAASVPEMFPLSASTITCIRVSDLKITSYEINTKAMVKAALEKR